MPATEVTDAMRRIVSTTPGIDPEMFRLISECEQRLANASESIRWYQVLTSTCDGAMLRGKMKAAGKLNETNDPYLRKEPTP